MSGPGQVQSWVPCPQPTSSTRAGGRPSCGDPRAGPEHLLADTSRSRPSTPSSGPCPARTGCPCRRPRPFSLIMVLPLIIANADSRRARASHQHERQYPDASLRHGTARHCCYDRRPPMRAGLLLPAAQGEPARRLRPAVHGRSWLRQRQRVIGSAARAVPAPASLSGQGQARRPRRRAAVVPGQSIIYTAGCRAAKTCQRGIAGHQHRGPGRRVRGQRAVDDQPAHHARSTVSLGAQDPGRGVSGDAPSVSGRLATDHAVPAGQDVTGPGRRREHRVTSGGRDRAVRALLQAAGSSAACSACRNRSRGRVHAGSAAAQHGALS